MTDPARAPMLSFKRVSKSFGDRMVVDSVSFDIAAGEVTCLLGASGSGKSTCLRIAAGVERADSGEAHVEGRPVDSPDAFVAPEKRGVGLVFQDLALFPHLNARRNAAFGLFRQPRKQALARADELLALVGLSHLAHAFPHQLSGGEQQRLAVARALAPRPRVMLLDEPFSGLDDRLRDVVRGEVLSLLRHEGAATMFVTHDPDEALRSADHIVLLRDGRMVQSGRPRALLDAPADLAAAMFFSPICRIGGKVADGRVATPLGDVAAPALAEGARALAALRPRDVEIAGPGEGALMKIVEARLASDGVHARFAPTTATPEGLNAILPPDCALADGDDAHVKIKPGRGFVFPA